MNLKNSSIEFDGTLFGSSDIEDFVKQHGYAIATKRNLTGRQEDFHIFITHRSHAGFEMKRGDRIELGDRLSIPVLKLVPIDNSN